MHGQKGIEALRTPRQFRQDAGTEQDPLLGGLVGRSVARRHMATDPHVRSLLGTPNADGSRIGAAGRILGSAFAGGARGVRRPPVGRYLPGRFGLRLEEVAMVTAQGARRLSESPCDLHIAGQRARSCICRARSYRSVVRQGLTPAPEFGDVFPAFGRYGI